MRSSLNGSRLSATSTQSQIEDTRKEIERYKKNVYELESMFDAYPDLRRTHFSIAGEVEDTINRTVDALNEAETLVDKHTSPTRLRRIFEKIKPVGFRSNKLENMRNKTTDNNHNVETLTRRIETIARRQPAHVPGRSSFDIFNPTIERTIPFTEPYDEELCEF